VSARHHALVTGGGSGIGAAICRRLAGDGFGIVVIDRREPDHGAVDRFVMADLADRAALAGALREATDGLAVTRLVNNAGAVEPAAVEETTPEAIDTVVGVNIIAAVECVKATLPAMKAAGIGRIVSISSRAALGKELRTAYAATKAGLHGMTKTWALELGRHGITANAVGPGPIRTPLFERVNPPDAPRTKEIVARIPVGFMGEPEDVAEAVAFLASDRARFVTGQVLYVCGGMTVGNA